MATTSLPIRFPLTAARFATLPDAQKDARLRSSLLALGYDEAISLTFISKEDARRFSTAPELDLANPLSDEASVMRTSLVPGMLNMLAYNLNRGSENVRLFEAGNAFEAAGRKGGGDETQIVLGATGNVDADVVRGLAPGAAARPLSFFDLKGDVEDLLAALRPLGALGYDAQTADYYHPGRSARALMDGAMVAQFGQIHPDVAAARKLKQDVFVAEIYLDRLYQHDLRAGAVRSAAAVPGRGARLFVCVCRRVEFEKIHESVAGLGIAELREFRPGRSFPRRKSRRGKVFDSDAGEVSVR